MQLMPVIMTVSLYRRISFLLINIRLLSFVVGLGILSKDQVVIVEWNLGGSLLNISWTLLFDYMSCIFASTVLFISSNVVWYSQSYLATDKDADRFIFLVFGFVISMLLLIVSPNILRILLGWDGLGLISYCLVIYYPTKKSRSAGILTVLRNRVGDVCILLVISWFLVVGDFNFSVWILSSLDRLSSLILSFLIVFAAMTKRAQIPFSAWLPAAIAAPTPVSALVHSSTLVTAGVYLLIRFSHFIDTSISFFLLYSSVLTMFMSGLVAVYEYDLKKIIALSTLSQLGVMMFSISLGMHTVAFFHLITHALFKALLFLCAGVLIHGVGGSQDIRVYGSLVKEYPLVRVCMNLANLSLCGIPFLSGFYSKDIVVELACQGSWNLLIIGVIFISLGLTVAYSLRLVYYRLVESKSGGVISMICDQDYKMVLPIVNLTVFALFSGASLLWLIFSRPSLVFLPPSLKIGALLMIRIAGVIILASSADLSINSSTLFRFYRGSIWFMPILRGQGVRRQVIESGSFILKNIDQGWLEQMTFGVVSERTSVSSLYLSNLQSNGLKVHFVIFLIWIVLLAPFFMYFRSLSFKAWHWRC